MSTLAVVVNAVNPQKKLVAQVRRMCKRHNLRLVRDRSKGNWHETKMYQLQSCVVVAGNDFELTLEDVRGICEHLGGVQ